MMPMLLHSSVGALELGFCFGMLTQQVMPSLMIPFKHQLMAQHSTIAACLAGYIMQQRQHKNKAASDTSEAY